MVNWKELQITLGVMIPQVDFSGPIFNDFNIFNTKYPIFTLFMKNITIILSWIYFPALLLGCSQNPRSYETKPQDPVEIPQVFDQAAQFQLLPESSYLTWTGTKPTGKHDGTIGISYGRFYSRNDEIIGGSITFDMYDIDILNLKGQQKDKLTNHLKSSDFFDVENHPVSNFDIAEVIPIAADTLNNDITEDTQYELANTTHKITGNLTLRGTTLSISFPARLNIEPGRITAIAKFNIDRTKWGVSYWDESSLETRAKDKLIYNQVNVGFVLEAEID